MRETGNEREAGRELDADLCEALGARGRTVAYAWADRGKKENPLTIFTRPPLTDTGWERVTCDCSYKTYATADGKKWPHNAYVARRVSESVSDAFQVVEAMITEGWRVYIDGPRFGDTEWRVMFAKDRLNEWALAGTLPLATCRAALAALDATSPQRAVKNSPPGLSP